MDVTFAIKPSSYFLLASLISRINSKTNILTHLMYLSYVRILQAIDKDYVYGYLPDNIPG